jgi:hypothetical protein
MVATTFLAVLQSKTLSLPTWKPLPYSRQRLSINLRRLSLSSQRSTLHAAHEVIEAADARGPHTFPDARALGIVADPARFDRELNRLSS